MNSLLLFLMKSTLSLSLLYLGFSVLMRKETFFNLNRMVLLFMVICSMLIPFLHSPQLFHPIVHVEIDPIFQNVTVSEDPVQVINEPIAALSPDTVKETVKPVTLSVPTILIFIYFSGVLISFLLLAYSIGSVLLLFRKARKIKLNGIRLLIVSDDISAFSFGRNILISKNDYDTESEAIITHELSHIRLGHFYDLMLMELTKILFWFNPLVYRLVLDLKEIHEFQADDRAINSGIDATKYQLLIIQKCVGHQKFALANSFNHCQIKNRIVMMNKLKSSKAWRWKVATFLPMLALLLMAFGRTGENVNSAKKIPIQIASTISKQKSEVTPPFVIDIKKDGIFLMQKLVTLDEFRKLLPLTVANNPQSEVIVNIIDAFNSDLPAVRDIINNECDSKKVKYVRLTQKFTPPSTSEIKIPKRNTFSIQIDAKGKVVIGFDGQDNRRKLLTRLGEDYNIVFSPKELEEFSNTDSFGVPMNRMKAFLKMSAEERRKPENAIGIPYDSGNNEFKNWVRTARTVNKDMRIAIKGDQATSYQVIDQLIETLQELNEYRLYMALAEWVTAYEVAFPSKKPAGEQKGPVIKFTQSYVLDYARSKPSVITIIPDKDNSIYYYLGTQDAKGNNPVLTKTDLSPSGIHAFLINKNHDILAKLEDLRKKKQDLKLSEEEFEKQRDEILSDKNAPIVLIKPSEASTYGSLMNILDEMVICSIGRYAIIDIADYDKNLISKAR